MIVVFIVDLKIVVMLVAQITMLKFMEFALLMFLHCTVEIWYRLVARV